MYSTECKEINGRICSHLLLKAVCGNLYDQVIANRKCYLRCLEAIDRKKVQLCDKQVSEIDVDLSDIVDDEDFEELFMSKQEFYVLLYPLLDIFKQKLEKGIQV